MWCPCGVTPISSIRFFFTPISCLTPEHSDLCLPTWHCTKFISQFSWKHWQQVIISVCPALSVVNDEFVNSTDPIAEVPPDWSTSLTLAPFPAVWSTGGGCWQPMFVDIHGLFRHLESSLCISLQGITWGLTDVSSGSSMITMREELVKTGWDKSYSWCTFPWEKFDALWRTCTQLLCPCRKSCHCIRMRWENCSSLDDKIPPAEICALLVLELLCWESTSTVWQPLQRTQPLWLIYHREEKVALLRGTDPGNGNEAAAEPWELTLMGWGARGGSLPQWLLCV